VPAGPPKTELRSSVASGSPADTAGTPSDQLAEQPITVIALLTLNGACLIGLDRAPGHGITLSPDKDGGGYPVIDCADTRQARSKPGLTCTNYGARYWD
jgi:hypothetical protein